MLELSDKAGLRKHFRAERDQFVAELTPAAKALTFGRLPSPLAQLCVPGSTLAGYIATGSEASPARLMAEAERLGCKLALPHVTSRSAPMRFLRWRTGEPLEPGPFGLLQPGAGSAAVRPDIVLLPLVAFDARLMRLGQGAAHYDRALSLLPDARKIGIAWSVQQTDILPADPWDVPVDAVLTEKSWISR